jgi:LETM1 and EF-hand domain-containing protein 1
MYSIARRSLLEAAARRPVHCYFAPALRGRNYATETQTSSSSPAPPPYIHIKPSQASSSAPAAPAEKIALNELDTPKSEAVAKAKETAVEAAPKGSRWSRIKAVVKHEAAHYWNGSKLLAKEVRISGGLLSALLRGRKLTRREHRQLKRTTQDLLRLIPFSVFVIVPFMEFLLPVALKLFPNMLPSTFTDKHKEVRGSPICTHVLVLIRFAQDEKKRKLLKVRIEMAKFLQETLRESGVKSPDKIKNSAEFKEFFRKVRSLKDFQNALRRGTGPGYW